jgi:hypothetical protein
MTYDQPSRISLAELLTSGTLAYACSIAAFNAGYFADIPGRFVDLFTFSDLVGVNIPIIQYFVSVSSVYFVMSIISQMFLSGLRQRSKDWAETFALQHHYDRKLFWAAYLVLLGVVMIMTSLANGFAPFSFTAQILPGFIFSGVLFYFYWVGYKFDIVPTKVLVTACAIGIFYFSYTSGGAWLKSDMRSTEGLQTIMMQDGSCIDRKILRSSGNGLLLFNPLDKQFEFRNKDFFRTIFEKTGCPTIVPPSNPVH